MTNIQSNNEPKTLHDWALFYWDVLQWTVLPIRRGTKHPSLIEWKMFEERRPTRHEIDKWFKNKTQKDVGIGVVTGELSSLTVVDHDSYKQKEGAPTLDSTLISRTGSGGKHYFFTFDERAKNTVNENVAVDIKSEGGFIVLPPTIHPNGKPYEWL